MNAGRGIEQLIADWLVEEAAPGVPDRVLHSTRQVVNRTNQRRFAAIWRESMFTPARLAALAATLVIGLGAGLWIGRATAPQGPGAPVATPQPTSEATASEQTLESYRAARNEICTNYAAELNPLKPGFDGLYDPETSAADRAAKATSLSHYADRADALNAELGALDAPSSLVSDHLASVTRLQDTISLIRQAIALLDSGDLVGAQALDVATDPLSGQIEAFERKYSLAPCP